MLIQWSALLITEPEVAMSSVPIQDNFCYEDNYFVLYLDFIYISV